MTMVLGSKCKGRGRLTRITRAAGVIAAAVVVGAAFLAGCARPADTTTTGTTTRPATTSAATSAPPITTTSKPTTTAAPTTAKTAAPTGPSGELRLAVSSFGQEKFNPPANSASSGYVVMAPVLDWMFWAEAPGRVSPGIVEKWALAPNGLSYTYTVRKGVKFHNGQDLTAKDVKFSIEQYGGPKAPYSNTRDAIGTIDLVDDYTLRVNTKGLQQYLRAYQGLSSPMQGAVMPKDYVEGKGWENYEAQPVGSGPFKYVRRVPGDMVEFEAMPSHWRQTSAFKKLSLVLIPEEATRIAAVKTGQTDLAEVNLDSVPALKSAGFQTAVVDQVSFESYLYGAYDPKNAKLPISDIKVRRALAISINREEIKNSFFRGLGGPAMPAKATEATLDIDAPYWAKYFADLYKYDPEEAKRLLKEAGYPERFSTPAIKLYAHPIAGAPWLPQITEIIAGYWSKVGVRAEVTPVDYGVLVSWWATPLNPALDGANSMMRTPTSSNILVRGLESTFGSKGRLHLLEDKVPEVDRLIAAINAELDETKMRDLNAQAIKIIHDTYVAFQIGSAPSMVVIGPGLDVSGWTTPLPSPVLTHWVSSIKHK